MTGPRQNWRGGHQPHAQNPLYFIPSPQYPIYNAQPYARAPSYPQWRAPVIQNHSMALQVQRGPPRSNFWPRAEFKRDNMVKENFTPIGISYTSLFHRLRKINVLNPIERRIPNPPLKNLDYSKRCEYCSDDPGHDTEKCWYLKRVIQDLINT